MSSEAPFVAAPAPAGQPRPEAAISPIPAFLERLHQRFAAETSGEVASYIPELAKADPAAFGIAIATADGQVYEVGDARTLFTIQSVSKPLVYGVALEDAGVEAVGLCRPAAGHRRGGV